MVRGLSKAGQEPTENGNWRVPEWVHENMEIKSNRLKDKKTLNTREVYIFRDLEMETKDN